MKLAALAEKTRHILPLLACPHCGQGFTLADERSLLCKSRHCYDLSAKGYINLAPGHQQQGTQYNGPLFESRRSLFAQGFYQPVMEAIAGAISAHAPGHEPLSILDAGCGEGSYARHLARCFPNAQMIGIDLSRDGISAAAKPPAPVHWLVANLSRLPIQKSGVSVLLDILTPADYGEFFRVLKPGGLFLKVIPGQDYLIQVRNAVRDELRQGDYDNQRVLAHLEKHARLLERKTLRYTLPVSLEQSSLFARMTPMTSSLSPEKLDGLSFSEITIHLELAVCRAG